MNNDLKLFDRLADSDLQLILFGGKGGVGKTSLATAAALRLAALNPEKPTCLISTDPAHSLADCLGDSKLPNNLHVDEFDSASALTTFLARHKNTLKEIGSRGTFLDGEDLDRIFEMALPGMDELFAFLEISAMVSESELLIVDTAPTGHTLRLLSLPDFNRKWLAALDTMLGKHRYMKKVFGGKYQKDFVDDFLLFFSEANSRLLTILADKHACSFIPVMLAETISVSETLLLLGELESLHIDAADIVINRLVTRNKKCAFCSGVVHRQSKIVHDISSKTDQKLWVAPLLQTELKGTDPLASIAEAIKEYKGGNSKEDLTFPVAPQPIQRVSFEDNRPLSLPKQKLFLFGGKGGVGKSTMACATAIKLAEKKKSRVLLLSSDPAHSLSDCLQIKIGNKHKNITPNLSCLEPDSDDQWQQLKKKYDSELKKFLAGLSESLDFTFDRQVMERLLDLSPPGLDEIIAITSVLDVLEEKGSRLVIDSAPTGHLIRLLQTPEILDDWLKTFFALFLKYKHVLQFPKITEQLIDISKKLKKLRKTLADADSAGLILVTIPTSMALAECQDLKDECKKLHINVAGLIINMKSGHKNCPLGQALGEREQVVITQYRTMFSRVPTTIVSACREPLGVNLLSELGDVLYGPAIEKGATGNAEI